MDLGVEKYFLTYFRKIDKKWKRFYSSKNTNFNHFVCFKTKFWTVETFAGWKSLLKQYIRLANEIGPEIVDQISAARKRIVYLKSH